MEPLARVQFPLAALIKKNVSFFLWIVSLRAACDNSHMPDEVKKKKVLLVEDDVFMSELLGKALERAGFDLVSAHSGGEGLQKFQEAKPDIVLLDLILPDQNGFDALRQIRRVPGGAEAKVLVLSNLARESQFEEAKRLGVTDYLVKANFSLDEILAKINETLAQEKK